jgi:hypothetical protein
MLLNGLVSVNLLARSDLSNFARLIQVPPVLYLVLHNLLQQLAGGVPLITLDEDLWLYLHYL